MIADNPIAAPPGLDVKSYGKLLAGFAPRVITTEVENEAALAIVSNLMQKGDNGRSAEEDAALELLSSLLERFGKTACPIQDADTKDLADIPGSRAKVSEILSGKRSISKGQANASAAGSTFRPQPSSKAASLHMANQS